MKDIDSLISQMTLEEKASLCSGLNFWYLKGMERLGIPSIMLTDGPHGLRKQASDPTRVGLTESIPATCFPTASALAATWNRDLVYQVGQALGEECLQEKVAVILGPGANIKRSPLCGRNFEYFSEDPFLSGEIAGSHIKGVQSRGIGASLKHYAVNNQETRRMTIDAVVDERALREIYLAGFEKAVREAQPWTVMCSYNRVNGTYASENKYLVNDILKEEWGHKGLVVTDWGAMNQRLEALKAGIELEMPGTANENDGLIVSAVHDGSLGESVLDDAVARILALIFKTDETLAHDFSYDARAHHALARRAAGEGAVLLKNEGPLLPLKQESRVALVGRFARFPRYQGAGSSLMNPTQLDNIHDEIIQLVGGSNLVYAEGYTETGDHPDELLIQQALQVSRDADVVVICAGLTDHYEVEGIDRRHMRLPPGHDALIERLAVAHDRIIVVLNNGSPVEMRWVHAVPCILEGYLGGQAGAGAIADILYGFVNPSGKLAESFPIKLEDNPSHFYFPGGPSTVEYRESIYVGYRYYDAVDQQVLFPFGHGLSYTSFEYSQLVLEKAIKSSGLEVLVHLKIRNTGSVAGREVVQVYVGDVESTVFRPPKELKGFTKVELQPGEEAEVTITLDRRAFAFYDPGQKNWVVEAGQFDILVASSSRDIRLTASLHMDSSQLASPMDGKRLASYFNPQKGMPVTRDEFESLLRRSLPANLVLRKGDYTLNTPIEDMSESFLARLLLRVIRRQVVARIQGQEGTPTAMLMETMLFEIPLRSILMFVEGPFNREMFMALLAIINGRFFQGLGALLKEAWKKFTAPR